MAIGPLTLLELPLALGLAAPLAFLAARFGSTSGFAPLPLVGGVLAGDFIGALVIAPIAIGELEVIHAPVVFASMTALGLQPMAAFLGARLSRPRAARA